MTIIPGKSRLQKSLCAVQLTHPGGEHYITKIEQKKGIKFWNYLYHRRKFMHACGKYVSGSTLKDAKLAFWGEWEPESFISPSGTSSPSYIHYPILIWDTTAGRPLAPDYNKKCYMRENTDPFVFAEHFYYSCCKLYRKKKDSSGRVIVYPTQLAKLEKGSIILFGSTINRGKPNAYFALDTVFVVDESREYTTENYKVNLKSFIPPKYSDIMGFDICPDNAPRICYRGASFANPVYGMFSFVPCKVVGNGKTVFHRVKLTSSDIPWLINDLNTTPHTLKGQTIMQNQSLWKKLCSITKRQECELGVQFEYDLVPAKFSAKTICDYKEIAGLIGEKETKGEAVVEQCKEKQYKKS